MSFGLENALGEVTLVLFTTLAPAGAAACAIVCVILLLPALEQPCRERIAQRLWIPILVALVGLVASATHLGNPSNALYVLTGVGRSPLSNEIFFAVVAFGLAGGYWLASFSRVRHLGLERAWLVLAACGALAFLVAMAFAYDVETIVTWSLPTVPLGVVLNAFVAGPLIALVVLVVAERSFGKTRADGGRAVGGQVGDAVGVDARIADGRAAGALAGGGVAGERDYGCSESHAANASGQAASRQTEKSHSRLPMYNLRIGRVLVVMSIVALVANVACYFAQDSMMAEMANSALSVSQLAPLHGPCIAVFAALAASGVAIDFVAVFRRRSVAPSCAILASALALAGIFAMRFVFYMTHLTVGVSL